MSLPPVQGGSQEVKFLAALSVLGLAPFLGVLICLFVIVCSFKGLVCLGFASFWGWVVYFITVCMFFFFYLFFFLSLPYPHPLCFSLPLPPSPSCSLSLTLIFLPFFRASLIHRSLSLPFIHRRLNTTFRQKRS